MTSWFMYQGGIAELFFVFIYVPSCIVFLYFIKKKQLKMGVKRPLILLTRIVLGVALFVTMTWKPILAKHYFDAYCEADGGNYVSSSQRVDSMFLQMPPHEIAAKQLLNRGLDYIESDNDGNGIIRQWLNKDGELELEYTDESTSDFEFEYSAPARVKPDFISIKRSDFFIRNRRTGEVIAGYRNYMYTHGTWPKFNITGLAGNLECRETAPFENNPRYSDSAGYWRSITARNTEKELNK